MSPAKVEARMDSLFSFPVGLFHPLLHAGLSRRSPGGRLAVQNAALGVCSQLGMENEIFRIFLFVRAGLPAREDP